MTLKRKAATISTDRDECPGQDESGLRLEVLPDEVFVPPSISISVLKSGQSYTYHSPVPSDVLKDLSQPCVMGIDEAGRGPVLGPMVYGVAYLPLPQHRSLLANTYRFDDSKVLTPEVRSSLLQQWCTSSTSLHSATGWAVRLMSARDIGAGMLRPAHISGYNLNQQAMDATVSLIQETLDRGINLAEIYIDTIGKPEVYQKKLERIFPGAKIIVAKKADSLYPCVSAASVAAKVTRDAALEVLWGQFHGSAIQEGSESSTADTLSHPALATEKPKSSQKSKQTKDVLASSHANQGWGSGYPSDARCAGWLKGAMHPLFGWGQECRFSWGTAKDLLEEDKKGAQVVWPEAGNDADYQISRFFPGFGSAEDPLEVDDGDDLLDENWKRLSSWFGSSQAIAA